MSNTTQSFNEYDIPFGDELPVVANHRCAVVAWNGNLTTSEKQDFLQVVKPSSKLKTSKFAPLSITEVLALPPQQYLVEGILPKKGLAIWYGAPGCGKTFLVLDLSLTLAAQRPNWFGRQAQGASVVYVAGEGLGGLSNRLRAWVEANNTTPSSFLIVPTPPNLFDGEAEEFAQTIANSKPNLIVIDTLARSSVGGDENSVRDMGKVIQACDLLVKQLNCCVLLIHHAGRSGTERGSTALRGASDVMLEVKKHDDGIRELVLNGQSAKIKDGAESDSIFFRLEQVADSCVVAESDPAIKGRKKPMPKGSKQKLVYELAGQALKEQSVEITGRPTITFAQLHERWQGAVKVARDREANSLKRTLRPMLEAGILGGGETAIWCP